MAVALLLASCATRPPRPPAPEAAPPALSAIHQGLGPADTLWHVRAGLNVAALSCPSRVGDGIVRDYNSFLQQKSAELGRAYAEISGRYQAAGSGWERKFDADMTRLYNYFASPGAQAGFCAAAVVEVKRALAAPAGTDLGWAGGVLARLDRPFAAPAAPVRTASAAPPAPAPAPAAGGRRAARTGAWKIQLGAFASRANAQRAWARLGSRNARIAAMQVHYEPVPGRPLTRLQVMDVRDQTHAIQLCAQAAASGFDCFPVRAE